MSLVWLWIMEPMLFVTIGSSIYFKTLASGTIPKALIIICSGELGWAASSPGYRVGGGAGHRVWRCGGGVFKHAPWMLHSVALRCCGSAKARARAKTLGEQAGVPCHSPCTVLPSRPGAAPPPLPPCRRPGDSRGDDVPGDGGDGVHVAGACLLRSCLDAQGHRASCAVGWVRCGGTLGRAGRFPCCPSLLCMLPLAARASAAQGRCAPHLSVALALLQPPRWP